MSTTKKTSPEKARNVVDPPDYEIMVFNALKRFAFALRGLERLDDFIEHDLEDDDERDFAEWLGILEEVRLNIYWCMNQMPKS